MSAYLYMVMCLRFKYLRLVFQLRFTSVPNSHDATNRQDFRWKIFDSAPGWGASLQRTLGTQAPHRRCRGESQTGLAGIEHGRCRGRPFPRRLRKVRHRTRPLPCLRPGVDESGSRASERKRRREKAVKADLKASPKRKQG